MPLSGFANARLGRDLDAVVLLDASGEVTRFTVSDGRVVAAEPAGVMARYDIALRFTAEGWEKFRADPPPPRWGDLLALRRHGAVTIEGDTRLFFAYLPWFKAAFARPRPSEPQPTFQPGYDAITGRYFHMELEGRPHRVFIEEAGAGIPLLLLHTAGSDARQWRHILNDPAVTSRFRCIAPDMPWHGKSSPPAGWEREEYRLTTAAYTGFAMALSAALGADRPVVMGCSIGGRIVLDLAARHAGELRGVIGLQGSAFVHPYYDTTMLHHPQVHGGEVCAAAVSGLIAPTAPEADRHETLWHYMQGGPGVFRGDLHFYKEEGDLRPLLARIDTANFPVHLLTGEHDYSCRPEDTLATAAAIPGAVATIMEGLGHFPMSEDYAALRPHLLPVLEAFASRG
nr:alpha/beta hydrolase [uncultured Roseococcus sp.]